MAKYNVTYTCGHGGVIELYGPSAERERKIEWTETNQTCRDCYITAKQSNPDPVAIYIRGIPGHDPVFWAAAVAKAADEIARLGADIARYAADKALHDAQDAAGIHWGHKDYRNCTDTMTRVRYEDDAKRRLSSATSTRESAARQAAKPATDPTLEICVLNSYAIKDALKARGYRYSADTGIGRSGNGVHAISLNGGRPGWIKGCPTADAGGVEISWLKSLNPTATLQTLDFGHNLVASIIAGRPDLVGIA